VGVTDNFFDLGVRSIVAAKLFAAIEREIGDSLPLGAIFRAPTIERLARLIDGEESSEAARWTSLVPVQPEGSQTPIFCVHGGAGTILYLKGLSRSLGSDQPFYALQARGLYGRVPPLRTIEEMATHFLSEMREVHPGGPWRLSGYCFGAIVAFEMAQQLLAAGEEVELLASFNGPSPTWIRKWGWYGNQPSQRAKHGTTPVRKTKRERIVRALRDPRKLYTGLLWDTRRWRARLSLALGRPLPERLREHYFFGLHNRAELAYEPKHYPGEMLVFYGEGLYEDPEMGWGGLAEKVRTFGIPGADNNNRQAMRDPGASFVAGHINEYLNGVAAGDEAAASVRG
jgi:hypothetical protein